MNDSEQQNSKQQNSDQRKDQRYRCRCYATVLSTSTTWEAHLLNLSQSGALVGVIVDHGIQADDPIELLIEISEGETLNLKGAVAHVNEHYVGIKCEPLTQNDYAKHMHKLESLGRETHSVA